MGLKGSSAFVAAILTFLTFLTPCQAGNHLPTITMCKVFGCAFWLKNVRNSAVFFPLCNQAPSGSVKWTRTLKKPIEESNVSMRPPGTELGWEGLIFLTEIWQGRSEKPRWRLGWNKGPSLCGGHFDCFDFFRSPCPLLPCGSPSLLLLADE